LAQISGEGVCNPAAGSEFACYYGDQLYTVPLNQWAVDAYGNWYANPKVISAYHNPMSTSFDRAQSGTIGSSIAPSTVRVMASYERVLTNKISLEGRFGAAFGGAPDSGFADLIHAEARGKYWFSGMGNGLRLFGLLGAGLGQVDAKKELAVTEFAADNSPVHSVACPPMQDCYVTVTAYRKLGTTFVTGGLGALLNLGGHGPVLEVSGRFMFPESGLVLLPSLGWIVGF
jgi:hypothetical protein